MSTSSKHHSSLMGRHNTITANEITTDSHENQTGMFLLAERLVFAKHGTIWWPAVLYENVVEFEAHIAEELDRSGDLPTKARIARDLLKERYQTNNKKKKIQYIRIVRYLGRPLKQYGRAKDLEYLNFFTNMSRILPEFQNQPHKFHGSKTLYQQFHKGWEEAYAILQQNISMDDDEDEEGEDDEDDNDGESTEAPAIYEQAMKIWNETEQPRQHQHNQNPPSPIGNHSVAAVSLAEDSTHATPRTHHEEEQTISSSHWEPPALDTSPIHAGVSWDSVWLKMQFSGWEFWDQDGTMVYKSPNHDDLFTLEEVQDIAENCYGWKPPAHERSSKASMIPRRLLETHHEDDEDDEPTRASRRKRGSNKVPHKFTFGVLWKEHLEPNGWKMEKGAGNLVDWYYIRPNQSINTGKLGTDFFSSTNSVLSYCRDHHDYPISSSASSVDEEEDDETLDPTSGEEDDERQALSVSQPQPQNHVFETPRGRQPMPQNPEKLQSESESSMESSIDPYHWKILWPKLKRYGWTYIRAKNPLQDYWYIRPRREPVVEGEDYFACIDDVIAYVKNCDTAEEQEHKATKKTKKAKAVSEINVEKQAPKANATLQLHKEDVAEEQNHEATKKTKKAKAVSEKKVEKQVKGKSNPVNKRKPRTKPAAPAKTHPYEINPKFNDAPWVMYPLSMVDYKVLSAATGIQYKGSLYYLPGETHKNFTYRFANLGEIQEHFCIHGNLPISETATSDEAKLVQTWIQYGFVGGKYHDWFRTRRLTKRELRFLLTKKLKFSLSPTGVWTREFQRFNTLELLCEAMRKRENLELEHRRGQKSNLRDFEKLALKLAFAAGTDGMKEGESMERPGASNERSEGGPKDNSERRNGGSGSGEDDNNSNHPRSPNQEPKNRDKENRENGKSGGKENSRKRSRQQSNGDGFKKRGSMITNLENEVLTVRWTNHNVMNPAPWCIDPPKSDSWFPLLKKMGVFYKANRYHLPGNDAKSKSQGFDSTNDVLNHFGTSCVYDISMLSSEEQQRFQKRISYTNVPGDYYEWKSVRQLETAEACTLLERLGFSRQNDGTQGWKVRNDLGLDKEVYPTLKDICIVLNSLPDLEGHHRGDYSKRGRRINEHKSALEKVEMMALRLFMAEYALSDGTPPPETAIETIKHVAPPAKETPREHPSPSGKSTSDQGSVSTYESEVITEVNEVLGSVIDGLEAFRLLQKVGWKYSSGTYRPPFMENERFASVDEAAQYLFIHGLPITEVKAGRLTTEEVNKLHKWLKFKHINAQRSSKQVYKALVGRLKYKRIIYKLGFMGSKESGYHACPGLKTDDYVCKCVLKPEDEISEEDFVNLIRRTQNLGELSVGNSCGSRRSKLLAVTKLNFEEEYSLRIWAALHECPLPNFSDDILRPAPAELHQDEEVDGMVIDGTEKKPIEISSPTSMEVEVRFSGKSSSEPLSPCDSEKLDDVSMDIDKADTNNMTGGKRKPNDS